MLTNVKFEAAGSLIEELSQQEIDTTAGQAAGGLFTIAGTHTIGFVCTISWECKGVLCSSWF